MRGTVSTRVDDEYMLATTYSVLGSQICPLFTVVLLPFIYCRTPEIWYMRYEPTAGEVDIHVLVYLSQMRGL